MPCLRWSPPAPTDTAFAQAGVLGQPGTSVLYGGNGVNAYDMRSGVRLAAGWWLGPTSRIEGEFFGLGTSHAGFSQSSSGNPILAQPYYNLSTGAESAYVVAYPSTGTAGHAVSGSVQVGVSSSFLVPVFTSCKTWCASTAAQTVRRVGTSSTASATCN